MTDIELMVSFVALLCGLLLANVANNLGDALRSRRDLPIGFVPWAINLYICIAVINQFTSVSGVSENWSSFGTSAMVVLCLMLLPYVVASRLLYPENKDSWETIEDYYLANRKVIIFVLMISPVSYAFSLIFYTPELVQKGPVLLFGSLPVISTLAVLTFVKSRIIHRIGWSFLITHRLGAMVWLAVVTG